MANTFKISTFGRAHLFSPMRSTWGAFVRIWQYCNVHNWRHSNRCLFPTTHLGDIFSELIELQITWGLDMSKQPHYDKNAIKQTMQRCHKLQVMHLDPISLINLDSFLSVEYSQLRELGIFISSEPGFDR